MNQPNYANYHMEDALATNGLGIKFNSDSLGQNYEPM